MKKIILLVAVAMITAIHVQAQKIEVVDADGNGIPLVSVLTEDGTYIGTTDLDGVLGDVKGAQKVAVTHVAYKPQLVTVASLQGGRITMDALDYVLDEIVVKPKPYIYVEAFYRAYVYRNDSLCYFLSGIMPNAYDPQRKKLEHGSYYQACGEYCAKFGAVVTWGARIQRFKAGQITMVSPTQQRIKDKYFLTIDDSNPNHWVYSNPESKVGQFVRSGSQARLTLDGSKMQMYANKAKGETKMLQKRQEIGYEYQYTRIYTNNEDSEFDITDFVMYSNHWEYNDKKSHVKFIIETYATDHGYMDKDEWKDKKKEMKTDYNPAMTLDELAAYERKHNIPALSPVTLQAIKKLKKY